jgi:chromodomain-helicase-DNA-binding protein 4
LSRAHRIGQTKPVMIFRLIISNSAEERVIQTASKKLVLEHLVVQKMDQELKTSELEDILKYGTLQVTFY